MRTDVVVASRCVVMCVIGLVAAGSFVPTAAATQRDLSVRATKGRHTTGPSLLIDHSGKVLAASNTEAIFWGPSSAFPTDAMTGIGQLLGGFNGSSYLATAAQYMRNAPLSTNFDGILTDPSAPPTHAPSVSTIVNEVSNELGTNAPDPNTVYLVYTSNFPKVRYCAWHASGTIAGVTVQVAYLPNTSGVAGCDPGD